MSSFEVDQVAQTLEQTTLSPTQEKIPYVRPFPELTKEQNEALESMKTAFENKESYHMPLDNYTFLRYLRARNFKVDKAQKMLNETLEWRKEMNLNDLYEGKWDSIIATENATGKVYSRGFDKDGHPILYMKPKNENTRSHDGNLKHIIYQMERIVNTMQTRREDRTARRELGETIPTTDDNNDEKIVLLIDFDGYSMFNSPPMKTSKETLNILQNHYPERLSCALCVRPPFIFNAFYNAIYPFIDTVTREKICMVSDSEIKKGKNERYNTKMNLDSLETCVGGKDDRPFDSKIYLAGGLFKEFNQVLSEYK